MKLDLTISRQCLAGVAACLLATSTGHAATLVYEGFETPGDYSAGVSVISQSGGGEGAWTSAWLGSTGPTTQLDSVDVTGLLTTPGKLVTAGTAGSVSRTFDTTAFNALGSEVWFSYAFDRHGAKQYQFYVANAATPNRYFGLSVGNDLTDLRAVIRSVGSTVVSSTDFATLIPDTDNFVIGRITFTPATINDRLDIWFNPSDFSSVAALGASTMFVETDWSGAQLDRIYLSTGTSVVDFDEIRVGSSLQDVAVAVPEPTAAAMGFGALGCLIWTLRFRRRLA